MIEVLKAGVSSHIVMIKEIEEQRIVRWHDGRDVKAEAEQERQWQCAYSSFVAKLCNRTILGVVESTSSHTFFFVGPDAAACCCPGARDSSGIFGAGRRPFDSSTGTSCELVWCECATMVMTSWNAATVATSSQNAYL